MANRGRRCGGERRHENAGIESLSSMSWIESRKMALYVFGGISSKGTVQHL